MDPIFQIQHIIHQSFLYPFIQTPLHKRYCVEAHKLYQSGASGLSSKNLLISGNIVLMSICAMMKGLRNHITPLTSNLIGYRDILCKPSDPCGQYQRSKHIPVYKFFPPVRDFSFAGKTIAHIENGSFYTFIFDCKAQTFQTLKRPLRRKWGIG